VEMIFDIHRYSEEKKVKLVVVEFTDYAMVWWERLVVERRRNRERPVNTWEELKTIMKKRYVPKHYYRELFNRLQMITQDNKSVNSPPPLSVSISMIGPHHFIRNDQISWKQV
jgi:hypothetical protein